MSAKNGLVIVGVVILLMGIAGLVPGWDYVIEPLWHTVLKVLIGLVSIVWGLSAK